MPLEILSSEFVQKINDEILVNCYVKWSRRPNGEQPLDSYCTNLILKKKYP